MKYKSIVSCCAVFAFLLTGYFCSANRFLIAQMIDTEQFASDAIKHWKNLKVEYLKGLDVELKLKIGDNVPAGMRTCFWKNYELNHHFPNADDASETLLVANEKYAFTLKRDTSSAIWRLEELFDNPANARKHNQFTHGLLLTSTYAFGGLMLEDGWLVDLVNSDSFAVVSSDRQKANIGNAEYLKIVFRSQHNLDRNNKVMEGYLLFDADRYFSIVEYNLTIEFSINDAVPPNKNVKHTYRTEKYYDYQMISDRFPYPTKTKSVYFIDGRPPSEAVVEYISVKDGEPSQEIFYLSHYGFSEPYDPTKRGNTIRIVFMVSGLILIVLSFYLRYKASKA